MEKNCKCYITAEFAGTATGMQVAEFYQGAPRICIPCVSSDRKAIPCMYKSVYKTSAYGGLNGLD